MRTKATKKVVVKDTFLKNILCFMSSSRHFRAEFGKKVKKIPQVLLKKFEMWPKKHILKKKMLQ
jgi:hypothetical protein